MSYLLPRRADFDAQLELAVQFNDRVTVEEMLKKVNLRLPDVLDRIIFLAALCGYTDWVYHLLILGASPECAIGGETMRQESIKSGGLELDQDLKQEYLRAGTDKHYAIARVGLTGNKKLIETFLSLGSDLNWAIYPAAFAGHKDLVLELLERRKGESEELRKRSLQLAIEGAKLRNRSQLVQVLESWK